ncbi:hypothetical protein NN561_008630 [Cricetulus griseus]
MKSPEPESAPARAAAEAEEGAGTRDPAPPCRLRLGLVRHLVSPGTLDSVRGVAWVGTHRKTAQDSTTGHPGLDVSGLTRVGHEVGKRPRGQRASATCEHRASPTPSVRPWTSQWIQSGSPPPTPVNN